MMYNEQEVGIHTVTWQLSCKLNNTSVYRDSVLNVIMYVFSLCN